MYSKVKSCVRSNQGLTDSFIKKVLVFDRPANVKKRVSKVWPRRNFKIIEEEKSYKYLCVPFKNDGSFTEHITILKEKADKAYYSIACVTEQTHE